MFMWVRCDQHQCVVAGGCFHLEGARAEWFLWLVPA